MTKTTMVSIVGMTLLLALLLSCGTLALAVREGMIEEQEHWLPSRGGRYQAIVKVGSDTLPWDPSRRALAINVWLHGRGTSWHVVNLLHVPIGEKERCANC